jgi:hypothetical protein
LHAVNLGGVRTLLGNEKIGVNCSEFSLLVDCLLNKVVDQETCDFMKTQMDVQVEPDDGPVQFVIRDELNSTEG